MGDTGVGDYGLSTGTYGDLGTTAPPTSYPTSVFDARPSDTLGTGGSNAGDVTQRDWFGLLTGVLNTTASIAAAKNMPKTSGGYYRDPKTGAVLLVGQSATVSRRRGDGLLLLLIIAGVFVVLAEKK